MLSELLPLLSTHPKMQSLTPSPPQLRHPQLSLSHTHTPPPTHTPTLSNFPPPNHPLVPHAIHPHPNLYTLTRAHTSPTLSPSFTHPAPPIKARGVPD